MALKFPLKCFFLFFKEKNIPKLENKGNPLPPNHTKLTLGAWRESMGTWEPGNLLLTLYLLKGGVGARLIQAWDPCHWHCLKASPRELVSVALPEQR